MVVSGVRSDATWEISELSRHAPADRQLVCLFKNARSRVVSLSVVYSLSSVQHGSSSSSSN
jgi:hypothetical protein